MRIKKIYLAEDLPNDEEGVPNKQKATEKGVLDYTLLNTDVIVQLDDGHTYKANFITLKKLASEFQANQKMMEGLAKKYFWSKSMVIVNDMVKEDLLPVVTYMIEEGDFQLIFEKLAK